MRALNPTHLYLGGWSHRRFMKWLLLLLGCLDVAASAESTALLSKEAAATLVMNTPAALVTEAGGGCPDVELAYEGKLLMSAQLRNMCPTSGSGLIVNFTVDLRTGEIWTGIDERKYVDSDRLRRLRTLLLSALVSGSAQVDAEDGSGFGCVARMTLPVYGGLIWQAQITGTATARMVVSAGGAASDVTIDSPHWALTGWIHGALGRAAFRKECAGRTIVLVFKYRLEGQEREAPDNQIILKHPGTVEITAYPPILHQIVD